MLKYFNRQRQKGQSTLEYAILIIIIVGALLSIQVYIKRGIQGKLKSSADDIGDQFSPGNTNVIKVMRSTSVSMDTFSKGVTKSELMQDEVTSDTFDSGIINTEQEYWGN